MKSNLFLACCLALLAACSDNASSDVGKTVKQKAGVDPQPDGTRTDEGAIDVDTIGMAEFLALKAASEARYGRTNAPRAGQTMVINGVDVDTIGFAEFKRLKAEAARKAFDDSSRRAEAVAAERRSRPSRTAAPNRSGNTRPDDNVTATPTKTDDASRGTAKEKKGWSNKAKGATIGAATGAAAGAVINKRNRGVGAVVGGVIGAAAGYGIGRHKDKKDTVEIKGQQLVEESDTLSVDE